MAVVPQLTLLGGLALAGLGTLTATDAVSLREVARHVDLPLLSASVIAVREAMPTTLAHAVEPFTAVAGFAACIVPFARGAFAPQAARRGAVGSGGCP